MLEPTLPPADHPEIETETQSQPAARMPLSRHCRPAARRHHHDTDRPAAAVAVESQSRLRLGLLATENHSRKRLPRVCQKHTTLVIYDSRCVTLTLATTAVVAQQSKSLAGNDLCSLATPAALSLRPGLILKKLTRCGVSTCHSQRPGTQLATNPGGRKARNLRRVYVPSCATRAC